MRAKYYAITLRQMKLKKSFVFFLIFSILLIILIYLFNIKLRPIVKKICENNAQNIAVKVSNEVVYSNIENLSYDNLITINKDSNGKVTSLCANSIEINKLIAKVNRNIEGRLEGITESKISIPLGAFFNDNLLSGYGPKIKLKTFPVGGVTTKLKSNFESAGINQTRHSLILEIKSEIKVMAPFVTETQECENSIVIAETVIVGDIPASYYNIDGVDSTYAIPKLLQ